MTKEGSTKIVNFMIPGLVVPVLGCGHAYKLYSEKYIISQKSLPLYTQA